MGALRLPVPLPVLVASTSGDQMNRREAIIVLVAMGAEPLAAGAQQAAKVSRIGFLAGNLAGREALLRKAGFTVFAGDQSQNWLIMKNGDHAIGPFQGMPHKRRCI